MNIISYSAIVMSIFYCLLHASDSARSDEPDPATPAPALKNVGQPPTKAEAIKFAEKLAKAVQAEDNGAVTRVIRLDSLAARLVSDMKLSKEERDGFMDGANQALEKGVFTKQIVGIIEAGGSYDFLHLRMVDGQPRPLFRLISPEGALNYHEFMLVRNQAGQIEVEDVYFYGTGEPVSQTIRQLVIPLLTDKNFMKTFGRKELDTLKTMRTISKSNRNGEFQAAIDAYHTLPKEKQELKPMMLMVMVALSQLGDESDADYLATMEKFRKLFPNDPAMDLISIDYFYLKGETDKGIEAIRRLNKAIGGDPYLDVFRGNLLIEAKQYDKARQAIEKAIKDEPSLKNAYWSRIALALAEKNHADTLTWLKAIVKAFNYELGGLDESPAYAEFVKSPQYKAFEKWNAEYNKNPK